MTARLRKGTIRRRLRWCGCGLCQKVIGIPAVYSRTQAKREARVESTTTERGDG